MRTAVGVAACGNIEELIGLSSLLVGIVFSALILPDLWTALPPVILFTGIAAFRVRRSWAYLRTLHTAGRIG
ncbi:hypothetical protein [Kocuria kalidii]|uniref:hypothetical protein n=1 Tax=Kocuria kalidii TaxID=3376283 RepID=UPI0037953523